MVPVLTSTCRLGTMLVKTASGKELIYAGLKSGDVLAIDPETHQRVVWKERLGPR
jgi:hypothetical protein